jgi:hypothetical protein
VLAAARLDGFNMHQFRAFRPMLFAVQGKLRDGWLG